MKRILFITMLLVGLSAAYGFAQMGQGHMMGQGMMGTQEKPGLQETQPPSGGGYHPCPMDHGMMGGMGPGMMGGMGPGMMGGMGPGMMGGMGPGMTCGMGPGMMGSGTYGEYAPEEYQKFMDDTADARRKLHNKKFEFFEAQRNPASSRDTLLKIEKEMHDLQWEIYEKSPR